MARAFVAIALPASVLDAVEVATAGLELPDARRTPREQWHLTLQFLGNHVDLDATTAALETLEAPRGRIQLGGAGAFPKPARATVLWIGVREGADYLTELTAAVTRATGVPSDDRPYRPHLTIARMKQPTDVRAAVDVLEREAYGDPWSVASVTLFESRASGRGVEHLIRWEVTLRR